MIIGNDAVTHTQFKQRSVESYIRIHSRSNSLRLFRSMLEQIVSNHIGKSIIDSISQLLALLKDSFNSNSFDHNEQGAISPYNCLREFGLWQYLQALCDVLIQKSLTTFDGKAILFGFLSNFISDGNGKVKLKALLTIMSKEWDKSFSSKVVSLTLIQWLLFER